MKKILIAGLSLFLLAACGDNETTGQVEQVKSEEAKAKEVKTEDKEAKKFESTEEKKFG
ncbi:hypothetical protein P4502_23275 [Peribacillus frigoritolerans]|uniref:hypothetical protein n=1 Tax=Peribacillus frigoritolerans TaxID=450367 RepID=UPI002E230407|nr:hypothetical protein [Peribacillus frigoritolerans]